MTTENLEDKARAWAEKEYPWSALPPSAGNGNPIVASAAFQAIAGARRQLAEAYLAGAAEAMQSAYELIMEMRQHEYTLGDIERAFREMAEGNVLYVPEAQK